MDSEKTYHWAAAAAAQLLNLGHIDNGQPKSMQFQKITSVIFDAMKMAGQEDRASMLTPSKN